ncbi:MAG TPA: MFS transporter [Alphaproteobacteria bacterium]|nr:MFS transporter [Alphaproteobacteria bacterium]
MITRRLVWCLGISQLVCWGISYYAIGAFGDLIAGELGWSPSRVYGGFSAALVVMGLSSPLAGRLVDRYGGRPVMTAGSGLTAIGCAALGLSRGPLSYYAAWLCLGLAMRLTLYEAAFAALARIGGPLARRPISQITLLGGLASTVFWPIGHALAEHFGWRSALLAYAGIALLTIPLHLAIPRGRFQPEPAKGAGGEGAPIAGRGRQLLAASLYAAIMTLANFLNSGMSAHMIPILADLGLAAATAVWIATLRGIGQSAARLCEVVFGARVHPLDLNLLATALLPTCFIAGLFGGRFIAAAVAFAFVYGAGNGVVTITRGTLPLVLFDPRIYGSFVGKLLVPSFLLSALAPLVYAFVIERFGDRAALDMSTGLAFLMLAAAVILRLRFAPSAQRASRGQIGRRSLR